MTGRDRAGADAPVTVIDYVSTTCSHCADWHVHVFDDLKESFIWHRPGADRLSRYA